MTDNEIIKALECCRDCKCKDCPCYNKEVNGCKEIDEQDILDLINRQKAEIFNLNKEISALKLKNDEFLKSNEKAKAEIEKKQSAYELCKQEYDSMFNANRNLLAEVEKLKEVTTNTVNSSIKFGLDKEKEIRKAKSEAYKEFAEKLKNCFCVSKEYLDIMNIIDNLVKEMVGDGNGNITTI